MQEFVNECQINAYSLYIISYLKDYIFAASGNARKKKTLCTLDLESWSRDYWTQPIQEAALVTWPHE